MIFYESPSLAQITLQGTPTELSTIYDEEKLGNTSFAIQIKQESLEDPDMIQKQREEMELLLNYMQI